MKTILFSICFMFFLTINAQTAEETVQDFFEALSTKDVETIDKLTLDDMNLHSLMLSDEIKLSSSNKTKFLESLKSIPKDVNIEERIFDIKVLTSEYFTQFQVPYEFYVNDKLSHKGTNVLTLVKTEMGWKISYIADTRELKKVN